MNENSRKFRKISLVFIKSFVSYRSYPILFWTNSVCHVRDDSKVLEKDNIITLDEKKRND